MKCLLLYVRDETELLLPATIDIEQLSGGRPEQRSREELDNKESTQTQGEEMEKNQIRKKRK